MWTLAEVLLAFVALWPVCTAAIWVAGGLRLPHASTSGTRWKRPPEAGPE